jgi:hypothetical protein
VGDAIRFDYGNAKLHGFLYDHLHVAEIEQRVDLIVKSKSGPIGLPIRTETRNAVRQYTDESIGDAGPGLCDGAAAAGGRRTLER